MIVTLTARCRSLLKKVVKLKTYMLILNCCINVLSHRNRFEYRTTVFIEYFWSWIQKRSIGSANERKIDLDSYDNFRLFHTFSNVMSRNLLVPYPDRAKAIKKKTKKFSENSNFCRLHIWSGCLSMMKSKISEPCAYMKCVNKKIIFRNLDQVGLKMQWFPWLIVFNIFVSKAP